MLKLNKNKKNAFSLVEILITILIISVLMVAAAPVLTRKAMVKKNEGVVFTYNTSDKTSTAKRCYITNADYTSPASETYTETNECARYEFTVPEGVHSVNLTLVAGGGGGGGAAGGKTISRSISTGVDPDTISENQTNGFIPDILKDVTIDFLAAKGGDGKDATIAAAPYKSGDGGASSPFISSFKIPFEYIRGLNFTNLLDVEKSRNIAASISVNNENSGASVSIQNNGTNSNVEYEISATHAISCKLGSGASITDTRTCMIPGETITESEAGSSGVSLNGSDTSYVNMVYEGGEGAKPSGLISGYGSGGAGASMQVSSCGSETAQNCTGSSAKMVKNRPLEQGKIGQASATYTIEYPGGTGGGGAAGSAVVIKAFPVTPGETYAVYVGRGGFGGEGGYSAETPLKGKDGNGGISSAIYKVGTNSETLVYMVNGGVGGEGGSIYDENKDDYIGASGQAGRAQSKFFYAGDLTNIKTDETVSLLTSTDVASNNSDIGNARRIIYPKLAEEPYNTLILNGETSNSDNLYGGFSDFETNSNNIVSNSKYNGFYYRGLIGNNAVYMGGLGGHTGFASKAGCGGYFMGNFDGRKNATDIPLSSELTIKEQNMNTFSISSNSYDVFTYYDNCNSTSPDGTTAEFVLPNPVMQTYGQAGAGGGGGGYSLIKGAGKGGDGQNGYVMINWQR